MQGTDGSPFPCQPHGRGCCSPCLITVLQSHPNPFHGTLLYLEPGLTFFISSSPRWIFHLHFLPLFTSLVLKAPKYSWSVTHPWAWPWNKEIFLISSMIIKQKQELPEKITGIAPWLIMDLFLTLPQFTFISSLFAQSCKKCRIWFHLDGFARFTLFSIVWIFPLHSLSWFLTFSSCLRTFQHWDPYFDAKGLCAWL